MIQHEVFDDMLNNPVRELVGRVEFYIYEDSTLSKVCGCYDDLKSFTIERVGANKFFGYGICQKLNVKLIDTERTTNISTANYLEAVFGVDSDYLYAFPAFYVTEVHRDEKTNQLSVTAYDALYNAGNHTVGELGITSYSIREFATACANLLGLPLNIRSNNSAFDLEYEEGANFEGTETIRQALDYIAEATQTIYYINNNWELTFRTLDLSGTPVLTVSKDKYFSLDSKTNRRLAKICHVTELGDNVSASLEESGSTQYVRDNPFWDLREDIGDIVDNALAVVGGLTINQFECDWRGNWLLEIGDCIGFTTKDDNVVVSYFLNDVISYDGTLKQKTQWKYDDNADETPSNPTTIGEALNQTFARVDKVNKEITLVAGKAEANSSSISAIKQNTESINASVSSLEKKVTEDKEAADGKFEEIEKKVEAQMTDEDVNLLISTAINNGITEVKTTTGFTFDADGLTVSKSDSDLSTQITEDGMTIDNNGSEVLTVNHNGVNAANLHATTYLFIGTTSRFEDFQKNNELRTGCFWVGR